MSAISNSLAELRKRKIELERELNRVNRAILVLADLSEPTRVVKSVPKPAYEKKCKTCGKPFKAVRANRKYCSPTCYPSMQFGKNSPKGNGAQPKKVVATLLKGDNLSH